MFLWICIKKLAVHRKFKETTLSIINISSVHLDKKNITFFEKSLKNF